MTAKKELNSENFSIEIINFLENNKAQKIVNISLKKKSNEADFMIIASGSSKRQVSSLSEKMIDYVKTNFKKKARTEGLGNSDWVLIDFGDIIVNIFREEVRDFYELEKIWDSNSLKILNYENRKI